MIACGEEVFSGADSNGSGSNGADPTHDSRFKELESTDEHAQQSCTKNVPRDVNGEHSASAPLSSDAIEHNKNGCQGV